MITRGARTCTGAAPIPETVHGISRVSPGQAATLTYLTWRNLHRARKLSLLAAAVFFVAAAAAMAVLGYGLIATLLLAGLVVVPAAMIGGIWLNTHPVRGWVVGLFSPSATLLVRQQGSRWNLSDHYAWVRGKGSARPFRVQAFAELARQADLLRVIIVTDTRVEKLTDAYLEDMPGLQLERTSQDTQDNTVYHLIRQPQPTSDNRNAHTSGRTREHE